MNEVKRMNQSVIGSILSLSAFSDISRNHPPLNSLRDIPETAARRQQNQGNKARE